MSRFLPVLFLCGFLGGGCGSGQSGNPFGVTKPILDPSTRRFVVQSNGDGTVTTYRLPDGTPISSAVASRTLQSDFAIYGLSYFQVIDPSTQAVPAAGFINGRYTVLVQAISPAGGYSFTVTNNLNNGRTVASFQFNGVQGIGAYLQKVTALSDGTAQQAAANAMLLATVGQ